MMFKNKEFNKAYVPVIISSIILILLIVGLIAVVLINPNSDTNNSNNIVVDKGEYKVNSDDVVVDTSTTSCSSSVANKIAKDASNVSVSFDVTTYSDGEKAITGGGEEEIDDEIVYDAYNIQFTNITKNIYIKVTNNLNDETKVLKYDDVKDGIASYISIYVTKKVKYTVTVYSNDDSCIGEVFRKFTFTTPIFNIYSKNCSDKKSDLCKVVVDEEISAQQIVNSNSEEANKKDDKEDNKGFNIVLVVVIAIIAISVIGGVVYYLIVKKKVRK